jgi:hypothetical protein
MFGAWDVKLIAKYIGYVFIEVLTGMQHDLIEPISFPDGPAYCGCRHE